MVNLSSILNSGFGRFIWSNGLEENWARLLLIFFSANFGCIWRFFKDPHLLRCAPLWKIIKYSHNFGKIKWRKALFKLNSSHFRVISGTYTKIHHYISKNSTNLCDNRSTLKNHQKMLAKKWRKAKYTLARSITCK